MQTIVYYSDFGAKGDGKRNDFYSIKAAHSFANDCGAKVLGDKDATYYIGKTAGESIIIKTDTDFCGARFIVDDRAIKPEDAERCAPLFIVKNETEPLCFGADSDEVKALAEACPIDITTKKLPISFGCTAMIVPYDSGKKVYKRLGATSNSGASQHELLIIDENGNIDETTPALLPYANVTKLDVYRVDDEPITVENGIFTTRANQAPREYTYYERDILVKRPNVTLKNIEHYITDESDTGAPYHPFFSIQETNNVRLEDCVVTGHKCFIERSARSNMGSYDIGGTCANNIYYKNCRQSNFFYPNGMPSLNEVTWGIMGSNYCKNITYDGCLLTRFDAHAGIYNGKVINSEIIYLRLTGGGKFTIKDSTIWGNEIISLRADYGCTWRGDVEIINCRLKNIRTPVNLFNARFYAHHNFGYQAYYPENILIDGLTLDIPSDVSIFNDITPDGDYDVTAEKVTIGGEEFENVNRMIIPEKVVIKNVNETTKSFKGSPDSVFDKQLKLVFE